MFFNPNCQLFKVYLENYYTNTRHVCTHFKAFFTWIPNMAMKFNISEIFEDIQNIIFENCCLLCRQRQGVESVKTLEELHTLHLLLESRVQSNSIEIISRLGLSTTPQHQFHGTNNQRPYLVQKRNLPNLARLIFSAIFLPNKPVSVFPPPPILLSSIIFCTTCIARRN